MKQNLFSHNPIQLAAISNFKLAQLTFAPPHLDSLRKTAVIKNMLESVYSNTPPEWLQQMTRWKFFTPESLEEMTQEGLEMIFAQYAQTIEAFRPVKENIIPPYVDMFIEDIEPEDEDMEQKKTYSTDSSCSSIFSQPNTTLANELVESAVDKPLPNNRKSVRLSWTSDTGITSGAISQNLANEIMSLFDMDFSVDIKIDTAPKLPELPFKHKAKQHRLSQDMLTSLLPEFEKIAYDHSSERSELDQRLYLEQKPMRIIQSVPQRSSSLKHRQEHMNNRVKPQVKVDQKMESSVNYPLSPPATPNIEKSLSRKKSLLKLASLVTKKSKKQQNSADDDDESVSRKASTSTVTSSTSSWSCVSESERRHKPLPETPRSPTSPEENSIKKKTYTKKKKRKSVVVMEKTMSKRKSNLLLNPTGDPIVEEKLTLSRSKSAFIKLGGGLKSKKSKQAKKAVTNRSFEEESKDIYSGSNTSQHSFVKRMASFMKPSRSSKPVEA
ncbi:hypothetical protein G6F43_005339 [Rhizopus delemar]|nr:hypothetical protein G6F43_005339 [Rhizopus delemar]